MFFIIKMTNVENVVIYSKYRNLADMHMHHPFLCSVIHSFIRLFAQKSDKQQEHK